MCQIVLTDDQLKLLQTGDELIELIDGRGHFVGRFRMSRFTVQEIAEAEKRIGSDGPWSTTPEMLQRLESLGPSR